MLIRLPFRAISSLIFLSAISCTWDQMDSTVDCPVSPVEAELIESSGTQCGTANGSFTIKASGGESPYVFTSGTGTNTDGIFTNIAAGNYTVVVTDAKGCADEVDVSVQNLNGVNLEEIDSDESGCGSANGSIKIVASGGEPPYLYSLNGGIAQEDSTFSGLDKGSYTIKVADQSGCEITKSVEILSGVSYENSIKGIIQNNCAVSGCHNGSQSPTLTSFSAIQSNARAIKSVTGSKRMPKGGSLSQDQIDMIACWTDDGALQN